MATPPFNIAQTSPAPTDLVSSFPADEQSNRDIIESWLTILSDPATGLLRNSAIVLPLTLTQAAAGNILTLVSTDAGNTGPILTLYQNSASPAVSDVIGILRFDGEDSAGNQQTYGDIFTLLVDTTSGSEDATMRSRISIDGTMTDRLTLNAAGVIAGGALTVGSGITASGTITTSPGAGGNGLQVQSNAAGVGPAYVAFADSDGTPRLGYVGAGAASTQINLIADLGNIVIQAIAGNISLTAGGGTINLNDATNVTGTLTATLFSGSGASLTSLNASNLASGTVPSARVAGSYTGITGTGALDAGSITSGFGTISTGNSISGSTGSFSSTLTAASTIHSAIGIFEGGDTTNVISATGAGTIVLRPNGTGVTTGQMTVGPTGLVTVNGNLTATGNISGSTGDFSSTLTVAGHILAEGTVIRGSATQLVLGTLGPTGDTGTIFLRPQGYNSAVGQATVNSAGRLDVADDIVAVGSIVTTSNGIHTNNKFAANPATAGCSLTASGQAVFAINDVFLIGNRTSSDGSLIHLRQANVTDGTISTAAGVVTYGTFFGAHWSQLQNDNSRPPILRGTICEHIDEVCHWDDNPYPEPLPKFKVSDTYGTTRPYGVFSTWDLDDDSGDAYIGGLGTFFIRIDAGETVQGGDWIMSAGNGCGVVMDPMDDPRKHVATVTAAVVSETYPDGSYLVPCTLHCG